MSKPATVLVGSTLFCIACLGLGALTVYYRDFALQWQPIAAALPFHAGLVWLSAALLLVCAIGLAIPARRAAASKLLVLNFALLWVLPQLLRLRPAFGSLGVWLGVCEALGAFCGAVAMLQTLAPTQRNAPRAKAAIVAFGACCVVYGLSHWVYADFTAAMIPGFLPLHQFLAYATGAVHILAGCALMFRIYPKTAAIVEAAMMSCFVLLLHVPSLIESPAPAWATDVRTQLTALYWATTLTAAAWAIAGYLVAPADK